MQTTIFLNGKIPRERIVKKFSGQDRYIIAADGGANYLKKKNIFPDIVIGDLDSIDKSVLRYFTKKKVKVERIEEQETTDFEKCLNACLEKKITEIVVFGATGKRTDHTLNNFSILKRYSEKLNIRFIENEFEIFFIGKETEFKYPTGQTISFLGLPKAVGVSTKGLQYPLTKEDLEFGIREGTLNTCVSGNVSISYESGNILLFRKHFIK